jgi:hypothetical protein
VLSGLKQFLVAERLAFVCTCNCNVLSCLEQFLDAGRWGFVFTCNLNVLSCLEQFLVVTITALKVKRQ